VILGAIVILSEAKDPPVNARNISQRGADGDSVSEEFYVYILANIRGQRPVLYVGVTNDIVRRVAEHRIHRRGFAGRYHVTTLVHVERTSHVRAAIAREKQIKGWSRAKKIALIEATNATWRDLQHDNDPLGVPSLRSG
jgi:putative endonuclease